MMDTGYSYHLPSSGQPFVDAGWEEFDEDSRYIMSFRWDGIIEIRSEEEVHRLVEEGKWPPHRGD